MASSLRAIPAVGSIAPDFEAFEHTGGTVTLGELASRRPLILVFYRGAY
ncbi:redoxin domain-containing protein [bacterium]|nr:MAG: redoxin domain-containing protein [bacterium]